MKRSLLVALVIMLAVCFTVAAADRPKVGVIQITLEHEYQIILHQGYLDKAKELGADVEFSITEMSPEKTVTAGENLIAAGCQAIVCAPGDPASFKAVEQMCLEHHVYCLNDGSPQEVDGNFAPFIGTQSYYGGQKAGQFAVNWINKNIPAGQEGCRRSFDAPHLHGLRAEKQGIRGISQGEPEAPVRNLQRRGYGDAAGRTYCDGKPFAGPSGH